MISPVRFKIRVDECNHLILARQGLTIAYQQLCIRVGGYMVCINTVMRNRDMLTKAGGKGAGLKFGWA